MAATGVSAPELPNLVTVLADTFAGNAFLQSLRHIEPVVFSIVIISSLSVFAILASRRLKIVPGRLQCSVEAVVGGADIFVRGMLGESGRKFTPFIGTLFIYILAMNLAGIVPMMKAPTSSWSTTLALAICVFIYLQYTSVRELGLLGYIDHLMGRPRGFLAATAVMPLLMLLLHVTSELLRPVSLSLRLRSNIWGDDMLLAVLAGFGLSGVPLLLFNTFLTILVAVVQACVFCLLTTIYFALVLTHEES